MISLNEITECIRRDGKSSGSAEAIRSWLCSPNPHHIKLETIQEHLANVSDYSPDTIPLHRTVFSDIYRYFHWIDLYQERLEHLLSESDEDYSLQKLHSRILATRSTMVKLWTAGGIDLLTRGKLIDRHVTQYCGIGEGRDAFIFDEKGILLEYSRRMTLDVSIEHKQLLMRKLASKCFLGKTFTERVLRKYAKRHSLSESQLGMIEHMDLGHVQDYIAGYTDVCFVLPEELINTNQESMNLFDLEGNGDRYSVLLDVRLLSDGSLRVSGLTKRRLFPIISACLILCYLRYVCGFAHVGPGYLKRHAASLAGVEEPDWEDVVTARKTGTIAWMFLAELKGIKHYS